jgi:hypothetical protein
MASLPISIPSCKLKLALLLRLLLPISTLAWSFGFPVSDIGAHIHALIPIADMGGYMVDMTALADIEANLFILTSDVGMRVCTWYTIFGVS